MEQKNILWILTDQWRAQATGYAGDPNANTPCLDRLCAESLRLDGAISSHPLCVPFRAALFTGCHGHVNGVTEFFDTLKPDIPTCVQTFAENGYDTALIGKWHLYDHDGITAKNHLTLTEEDMPYIPEESRGGFKYWRAFEGGNLLNDPILHGTGLEGQVRMPGYQSEVLVDEMLDYLRQSRSQPYYAVLSVEPPHPPYGLDANGVSPPDPASLQLRENVPEDEAVQKKTRSELSGYYAHIEATDRAIGRLLETSDQEGLLDDTLVFFFSDHGDMHGSNGYFRKCWPHEESIRIPALLRFPDRQLAGERCGALFNETDIAPTFLGLVGLPLPEGLHGRNQEPHWLAADQEGESTLIGIEEISALNKQGIIPWVGIRTSDASYTIDEAGEELFVYDLKNDPYQHENLAGSADKATWRKGLRDELRQELTRCDHPWLCCVNEDLPEKVQGFEKP